MPSQSRPQTGRASAGRHAYVARFSSITCDQTRSGSHGASRRSCASTAAVSDRWSSASCGPCALMTTDSSDRISGRADDGCARRRMSRRSKIHCPGPEASRSSPDGNVTGFE